MLKRMRGTWPEQGSAVCSRAGLPVGAHSRSAVLPGVVVYVYLLCLWWCVVCPDSATRGAWAAVTGQAAAASEEIVRHTEATDRAAPVLTSRVRFNRRLGRLVRGCKNKLGDTVEVHVGNDRAAVRSDAQMAIVNCTSIYLWRATRDEKTK